MLERGDLCRFGLVFCLGPGADGRYSQIACKRDAKADEGVPTVHIGSEEGVVDVEQGVVHAVDGGGEHKEHHADHEANTAGGKDRRLGAALPEQAAKERRDQAAEHEVKGQGEQDAGGGQASCDQDAGQSQRDHAGAHPGELRVVAVDGDVAAETAQVAHDHLGHAKNRARCSGEGRGHNAGEHDDGDDGGGVAAQELVEDGVLVAGKAQGACAGGGDQAVDDADEDGQAGAHKAGVACDLGALCAVDALLEVERDDIANTQGEDGRPVDGRALGGVGHLAHVKDAHAGVCAKAPVDKDEDAHDHGGDKRDGCLDGSGVGVGEQAAAQRVEQDERSHDKEACDVGQPQEVLEEVADGDQVACQQDDVGQDHDAGGQHLELMAVLDAKEVTQREQAHLVHGLCDKQTA